MDSLDNDNKVNKVCLTLLLNELLPMSVRIEEKLDNDSETSTKDTPGTVSILDSPLLPSHSTSLRLSFIGHSLGVKLAQSLSYKLSLSISNILDIMKFICRDIWKCLFSKQMDNLRTNHRGTFVLIDNSHPLISRNNSAKGIHDTLLKSKSALWLSSGVIKGALEVYGIESDVTAEINTFPSVVFNVVTNINN